MSRRIAVFLVAVLVLVSYVAVSFAGKDRPSGNSSSWTEAALVEMGSEAIPHVRERSMSQVAESIDAVALTFLTRSGSDEADALLVDMLQGNTGVDRNAALEMLLFEIPDQDRRALTMRPKVRAAILERASSGSPKTRAFVETMRAEDEF